jgi:DNA-binding NarL/FixJ family response regulator
MEKDAAKGVRVFLIDDHPAVRQGLALLLAQEAYVICGEAENRAEALGRLDTAAADVALVDLSLGEESGLDLIADLQSRNIPALMYSMFEDCGTIERAFGQGAAGYVTKREVSGVLLEAIGEVLAGRRYASPRAARSLASRAIAGGDAGGEEPLSQREEQIMARLGRGETNVEISGALHIGVRTVETYYARIIGKLGLGGMKELRKYAIQRYK